MKYNLLRGMKYARVSDCSSLHTEDNSVHTKDNSAPENLINIPHKSDAFVCMINSANGNYCDLTSGGYFFPFINRINLLKKSGFIAGLLHQTSLILFRVFGLKIRQHDGKRAVQAAHYQFNF